jgi:hypothetical protein
MKLIIGGFNAYLSWDWNLSSKRIAVELVQQGIIPRLVYPSL